MSPGRSIAHSRIADSVASIGRHLAGLKRYRYLTQCRFEMNCRPPQGHRSA